MKSQADNFGWASIGEIIRRIKELKGLSTDGEVARALGLKPQTLATAKMRGSMPYEALISFCDKERISLDLLLRGMELKAEEPVRIREPEPEPESKPEVETSYIMIPLLEAEAAAGISGAIPDDSVKDSYPFKRSWIRRIAGGPGKDRLGKIVLIKARGQSMQPTINDGELVLVNLRDRYEIKNDAIYVVHAPDGGIFIKRLISIPGGFICLSDNKTFKAFEIKLKPSESIDNYVLGRACWLGRELLWA
jgi:phage repressor protein C with HTH and peptisase S24 domain